LEKKHQRHNDIQWKCDQLKKDSSNMQSPIYCREFAIVAVVIVDGK
jgi:hypothetical protein